MPQLPSMIMKTMCVSRKSGGFHDPDNGGQFRPGTETAIHFKGALLPVSNKDLMTGEQGGFTKNSQKIYTDGFELLAGEMVIASDGKVYTVKQELTHTYITDTKLYLVEAKEASAQK